MFDAFPSKVPRPSNKKAKLLAESITSDPNLIRVPVIPDKSCIANNCFYNLMHKVEKDGGDTIYGWQIWDRQIFVEAGFHAIWRKGDILIDITPKEEREILFFEDKNKKFEGFKVDNVRQNFSGNPIVDDYIKIHEIIFMIENYGDNRYLHDPLEPIRICIPEPLVIIRRNIKQRVIPELMSFILSGKNQDSPCFCGGSLPYYSCHSEDIKQTYRKIREEYEKAITNSQTKNK